MTGLCRDPFTCLFKGPRNIFLCQLSCVFSVMACAQCSLAVSQYGQVKSFAEDESSVTLVRGPPGGRGAALNAGSHCIP